MPIDFAADDQPPEDKPSPGFVKAVWQVIYPGSENVPKEHHEVLAHLRELLKQKDREIHGSMVEAQEFQTLVEENVALRQRLDELEPPTGTEREGGGEDGAVGPVP